VTLLAYHNKSCLQHETKKKLAAEWIFFAEPAKDKKLTSAQKISGLGFSRRATRDEQHFNEARRAKKLR
jgi:hypothetical protein